jgi:hypothetical protein
MKPWWTLPTPELLKFLGVIFLALGVAWWLWRKGDEWTWGEEKEKE